MTVRKALGYLSFLTGFCLWLSLALSVNLDTDARHAGAPDSTQTEAPGGPAPTAAPPASIPAAEDTPAQAGVPPLVRKMREHEGLCERGGENRGEPIWERWGRRLGYKNPNPWCGISLAVQMNEAGVAIPEVRSGLAIHYRTGRSIPVKRYVREGRCPPAGAIAVYPHHVGVVTDCRFERGRGYVLTTISGNTSNPNGGPDGLFEKERPLTPTASFKPKWITPVTYHASESAQ